MSAKGIKRSLPTEGESNESSRPRKRTGPSTSDNESTAQTQRGRREEPQTERKDEPVSKRQQKSSTELKEKPSIERKEKPSIERKEEPKASPQTSSKESPKGVKRSLPVEDSNEAPRPRKRPGGASRISAADKEAVLKRQQDREEEARKEAATRGVHDVVRQHYNAVPQRGRDWRKTDSRIKGLRSFNNWVKSTIIHKFAPIDGGNGPPLRVLDLGCGKGGDLGKWQQAPQPVEILVGIDPAEVSIEQARERHSEMWRAGNRGGRGRGGRPQRTFDAEFITQDAFGHSIANIPIVRNIGFDPGTPVSRRGGGFDVVSMMFCMHYAFESEAKARGMLQNVAGSLVKGGRFFGTIPNSDVIRSKVEAFHKAQEGLRESADTQDPKITESQDSESAATEEVDGQAPLTKAESKDGEINLSSTTKATVELDIQSSSKAESKGDPKDVDVNLSLTARITKEVNGQPVGTSPSSSDSASKPPVKPLPAKNPETELLPVAEWGNDIFRVRFPGLTPKDGVFRPPFGWKYSYFMEEAVEEIPEYVVPWEAFRG